THTPVPAGHDRFPNEQVEVHLGELRKQLGLSREDFFALGKDPEDSSDRFCMTVLALKLSRRANAVSKLHGEVSRKMWRGLCPDRPVERAPIDHVTNGVHAGTWIGDGMRALLERHLGKDWLDRAADPGVWATVDEIPDEELWTTQLQMKEELVAYVRLRAA